MNIRNPITVDSLDKPNAPTGVQRTVKNTPDAVQLFGLVIGAIVLVTLFFLGKHELWGLIQTSYGAQRTLFEWLYSIVVALMVLLPLSVIGVLVYFWYNVSRTKAFISGMDAPVHVKQMNEMNANMQSLAVAMARMQQSMYNGVSTLTLDQSTASTSNSTSTSLEGIGSDTADGMPDEVALATLLKDTID